MNKLLMIVIDAIKTVDGNKGSLAHIEKAIINRKNKLNQMKLSKINKQIRP
jgi:hypothetical protein